MIVVSNTSPLTNLAAIGQFSLLQKLYSEIHIPTGVWEELNAMGKPWPGSKEVAEAQWIHQHNVQNQRWVQSLRKDLDKGESETIVLAAELNAQMVLMDEKEGRWAAKRVQLKPLGILGVLLEAKSRKFITETKPHIDALRYIAGFRIGQSLYEHLLTLSNEGG